MCVCVDGGVRELGAFRCVVSEAVTLERFQRPIQHNQSSSNQEGEEKEKRRGRGKQRQSESAEFIEKFKDFKVRIGVYGRRSCNDSDAYARSTCDYWTVGQAELPTQLIRDYHCTLWCIVLHEGRCKSGEMEED